MKVTEHGAEVGVKVIPGDEEAYSKFRFEILIEVN
jgi:hypothetical protein